MTGTNPIQEISRMFDEQQIQIEQLRESISTRMLQLEDIGWDKIGGVLDDGGPGLKVLKQLTPNLRDMAGANPLHKRGAQLRYSYVFGRGVEFTNLTPATQAVLDDLYNQATLFSVKAYETNNLEMFCAGNLFILRTEKTNQFSLVPIEQITAEATDPDDPSRVRYFLREWSNGKEKVQRWYPVSRYKKTQVGRGRRGSIAETIEYNSQPVPVAQDQVIYHESTQRQGGWRYGIPDSLAGAVWAVSYSGYLTDNATLVKALQQIAWAITSATKSGATNAAVGVSQPGTGGVATMGSGNTLSGVGVPSAQVNFNNGQPLAAMVATSFGVPVIALLSSPGATGGSYGAATTLDTPTIKGMKAVQDSWKLFYKEILADIGSPEAEVNFPNIEQDATYREVQSIGQAYADGRLFQEEAREATIAILDVRKTRKGLPKPDAFNAGKDPADTTNPEPSQGNTGAVPGGTDQDVTNHDPDTE
jgi:hypothetical protein